MNDSRPLSLTQKQARFERLTALLITRCYLEDIPIIGYRHRSTLEQDLAFFNQGKSEIDPRKHPTMHMLGLAVDFAVMKADGSGYDWENSAAYLRMGEIAESLGLKWGGRWTHLRDYNHIEYLDAT